MTHRTPRRYGAFPEPQGLYDPRWEHDACGVGFVVNMDGRKAHAIIDRGIEVLENLLHRGAVGGDQTTGDGAGILFQIPVGTMAVTRLAIVTPEQLAANRRYAVLAIAIAAMLLPGTDPVTMLISMAPLYALFELSLLLARRFGRPPATIGGWSAASSGS